MATENSRKNQNVHIRVCPLLYKKERNNVLSQTFINFYTLRKAFPTALDGEPIRVSTEELSNVLFCSQRNVKIIVSKMVNQGWVEFLSGKGRGHRSSLIFRKTLEEVLFDQASALLRQGELKEAVKLTKLYGDGTNTKARLAELLNEYFGYQIHKDDESQIEILRFPIFRPINTLDPACVFYDFDANVVHQIFNRLVHYNELSQKIEGQLAHFWHSNASGTKWVFHLRKGVLFHHGRELTSSDVAYTLQRLSTSAQKWLVKNIANVCIHDRYTIQIDFTAPNHVFLRYLSYTPMSIVPSDVCDLKSDSFAREPVGTGPFKCVKNTSTMCVLEAFQSYYAERAHLDRVEITRVPEDVQFWSPNHPSWERIFVDHGEANAYSNESWYDRAEVYAGSSVLTMNLSKQGPQSNANFREALNRLLNRTKMIEDLGSPRMYPSQGFQLRGSPTFIDPAYSPLDVASLLKKSNYNGEVLTLYTFERHAPDALWIKDECLSHGVHVDVHVVGWSEMLDVENIQKADCILFEAVVREGEVQQLELYQFSHSFIRLHLGHELTTVIDQEIDKIVAQSNENDRREMLLKIEQLLKHQHALIFLVHKKVDTAYHPSVRGVRMNSRVSVDFKEVWFQSEQSKQAVQE